MSYYHDDKRGLMQFQFHDNKTNKISNDDKSNRNTRSRKCKVIVDISMKNSKSKNPKLTNPNMVYRFFEDEYISIN
ncbi:hypothetical protein C1646_751583 [Rhizophagus diaphanus]|nr:hypothetical protein C1646_751583 [Rhizophagus diaphanus] [Rhizophagus sp. MUCL 43196]